MCKISKGLTFKIMDDFVSLNGGWAGLPGRPI